MKQQDEQEQQLAYYQQLCDMECWHIMREIISFDEIDEMYQGGYIPVIYNHCYGGFGWSDAAIWLMNMVRTKLGMVVQDDSYYQSNQKRIIKGDLLYAILGAKVCLYMRHVGHSPDDMYSNIRYDFVRQKHLKYVVVHEYDGLETISLDHSRFAVVSIQHVLKTCQSHERKLLDIGAIVSAPSAASILSGDIPIDIQTPEFNRDMLQFLQEPISTYDIEPDDVWIEVKPKVRTPKKTNKKQKPRKYKANYAHLSKHGNIED